MFIKLQRLGQVRLGYGGKLIDKIGDSKVVYFCEGKISIFL